MRSHSHYLTGLGKQNLKISLIFRSIEEDRLQTALTTAKVEGLQLEAQRVLDKTGTASLRVWPLAKDLGRVGEGPIIMANPLDKCVNLRLTRLLEANSECYTKKAKKKVELPTFGGDVLIAWSECGGKI